MRKQKAQRRMATASLVAMGGFTLAMFFIDIDRVKALSDISNLFYISGAGNDRDWETNWQSPFFFVPFVFANHVLIF